MVEQGVAEGEIEIRRRLLWRCGWSGRSRRSRSTGIGIGRLLDELFNDAYIERFGYRRRRTVRVEVESVRVVASSRPLDRACRGDRPGRL